jgi:hypothetical protein
MGAHKPHSEKCHAWKLFSPCSPAGHSRRMDAGRLRGWPVPVQPPALKHRPGIQSPRQTPCSRCFPCAPPASRAAGPRRGKAPTGRSSCLRRGRRIPAPRRCGRNTAAAGAQCTGGCRRVCPHGQSRTQPPASGSALAGHRTAPAPGAPEIGAAAGDDQDAKAVRLQQAEPSHWCTAA